MRDLIPRKPPSLFGALLLLLPIISTAADYGTDVSYPMHYHLDPDKIMGLEQSESYQNLMKGCYRTYSEEACNQVENDRIAMNLRQPQSMVNYTRNGYVKIRAPDAVWKLIQDFWSVNRHDTVPEEWINGSIFVNHWDADSEMVAVDNATLPGGGNTLKTAIWNAARETLSEWTGHHLADCSLWGVRIYHEGAILAPHVDRLPLVASAILNVDQDVDEPWPLEVIGHDGKATNVTMVPGDLVLYESHSIIHGRPFPLKGRFMANIFIHFEPLAPLSEPNPLESRAPLPPYILPNSPEIPVWQASNQDGWHAVTSQQLTGGTTEAHQIVGRRDLADLKYILNMHPHYANVADDLGWTPLHEAVRTLRMDLVQTLINYGADIQLKTNQGESVLFLAAYMAETSGLEYASHPMEHPMVRYLQGLGGKMEKDGYLWNGRYMERVEQEL